MPNQPVRVYIVDEDASVRIAYARLVDSAMMQSFTFSSVEDFLQSEFTDDKACVVSDVPMPGISGFELPVLLNRAGRELSVILITSCDTQEMRNVARCAGAVAYFRKPVDGQALLDAINWATSEHGAGK